MNERSGSTGTVDEKNNLQITPELIRPGNPAILTGNRVPVSFASRILQVSGNQLRLLNTVPYTLISRFVESESFILQVDLLKIAGSTLESDGKNFILTVDTVESINETRTDERFSFSTDENVRCEILNPMDEETILSKTVMDMSTSGFSLRTFSSSKLFKPGITFRSIKISIGAKPYATRDARSVYQRQYMDENGNMYQQVGLQFTDIESNDQTQ